MYARNVCGPKIAEVVFQILQIADVTLYFVEIAPPGNSNATPIWKSSSI